MKPFLFLLCLAFSACVGPAHDTAETIAPLCPGYHAYNQCEPWARAFKKEMEAKGHPVTLVGYQWSHHGETVNHLMAFWRDTDGWWARDNVSGPVQVDSFDRYDWETRVDNAVYPMTSEPTGDYHVANIRVLSPDF